MVHERGALVRLFRREYDYRKTSLLLLSWSYARARR